MKNEKTNVYKTISNFLKRERSEAEKALKSEKRQVCIKADSYIAKEIKYQTALLHEILDEVRSLKNVGTKERPQPNQSCKGEASNNSTNR